MDKTIFKCGICQKVYSDVEERMHCEAKCLQERKDAERRLEARRLLEEQKTRQQEVSDSYRKYVELREAYLNDYGTSYIPDVGLTSVLKNIFF